MHEVSYFCCIKHFLKSIQIGCYQNFVWSSWVCALRFKDDLIVLSVPDYAFMGEGCDFQARFKVSKFELGPSTHRGAVNAHTRRTFSDIVWQSDDFGLATTISR